MKDAKGRASSLFDPSFLKLLFGIQDGYDDRHGYDDREGDVFLERDSDGRMYIDGSKYGGTHYTGTVDVSGVVPAIGNWNLGF